MRVVAKSVSSDAAATTKGGDGVTYSKNVNVALAVTMPDGGLITPVIKVIFRPAQGLLPKTATSLCDLLDQPQYHKSATTHM